MEGILFGSRKPETEDAEEWRKYTVLCTDCLWYTGREKGDGQKLCSKYTMWSYPDQTCKSGKEKS